MKDKINRWVLIFLLFVLAIAWNYAIAEPVARAVEGGVSVILYSDICELDVQGLPMKATWGDGKRLWNACFDVRDPFFGMIRPPALIILMYFDDKSIVMLPAHLFKPYSGI